MTKLRTYESFTSAPARNWRVSYVGKLSSLKIACMVFVFCVITATLSPAQSTLTTLVNFDGTNGSSPDSMVLTQGVDGNFYGTTAYGGANNACTLSCGTFFQMTPLGTLTTLYNFCSRINCNDGSTPLGSLVQASNGDFYGTTGGGGTYGGGTVFKITPKGTLTTLYNFCALANCADGQEPAAGLVQGRNGNFYGTTGFGGVNGGGTVFEITSAGKLTTLYSFCALASCADGYDPQGTLTQTPNGNFYGETLFGGSGLGTIFEVTPGGKLTTLFSFNDTDGAYPTGGLIQAANGNFYGVTSNGGNSNPQCTYTCGTVFKVTSGGKLTTLYKFCSLTNCTDGAQPDGALVQATDGNLYGTTYGGNASAGTVFEITAGGTLTTLYTFCAQAACADGYFPLAGMLQATNGTFYGTTSGGGSGGVGTIFSVSVGLGPFVKTQPSSAKESATIGIFGQGFTSSSVVQFGGVQATSVKLSGTTFLTATVPTGALTGSVTVTTSGTTLTSSQQFRVMPQILSFNLPNGSVGTQVTITGVGFTQTLGVGFGDNVPAQFTINSDTEVTATVPTGAKTGPIGLVTKGGTSFSSATFMVN